MMDRLKATMSTLGMGLSDASGDDEQQQKEAGAVEKNASKESVASDSPWYKMKFGGNDEDEVQEEKKKKKEDQKPQEKSELHLMKAQMEVLEWENRQMRSDMADRSSCIVHTYIQLRDANDKLNVAFKSLKKVHKWHPGKKFKDAEKARNRARNKADSDKGIKNNGANLPGMLTSLVSLVDDMKAFVQDVSRKSYMQYLASGDIFKAEREHPTTTKLQAFNRLQDRLAVLPTSSLDTSCGSTPGSADLVHCMEGELVKIRSEREDLKEQLDFNKTLLDTQLSLADDLKRSLEQLHQRLQARNAVPRVECTTSTISLPRLHERPKCVEAAPSSKSLDMIERRQTPIPGPCVEESESASSLEPSSVLSAAQSSSNSSLDMVPELPLDSIPVLQCQEIPTACSTDNTNSNSNVSQARISAECPVIETMVETEGERLHSMEQAAVSSTSPQVQSLDHDNDLKQKLAEINETCRGAVDVFLS